MAPGVARALSPAPFAPALPENTAIAAVTATTARNKFMRHLPHRAGMGCPTPPIGLFPAPPRPKKFTAARLSPRSRSEHPLEESR